MRSPKASHTIDIVFALALFCAFSASVLLVLMTGVKVYKDSVKAIDLRFEERTSIAYITEKVRHYNAKGCVSIESFGDGSALRLSEEIDGVKYNTLIYTHDGKLMELYHEEGLSFKPEDGMVIVPMDKLSFSWQQDSLLHIECGSGVTYTETYLDVLSGKDGGAG